MRYEIMVPDVWGNSEDGFVVNSVSNTGAYLQFDPERLADTDLIVALQCMGYMERAPTEHLFTVSHDSGAIFVDYKDGGEPVLELWADSTAH